MELWGTAYSFHATTVTKLAGLVAASTHDSGGGTIRIVFDNNGDVIKVNATDQTIEVVIKWEVILQLTTLLHVLVLQKRTPTARFQDMPSGGRTLEIPRGSTK